MNKFLVFQTWGISDIIMSTPMISALRQRLPEAHIIVVASLRAADVVDGAPLRNAVRIISPGRMTIAGTSKGWRFEEEMEL